MQQLTMTADRQVEWWDVPAPALEGDGQALVRPLAVALCDLDQPILRGEAPIPGPIALGHEFVAEVIEVGDEVRAVAPGDRVVVPFQVSCGTCGPCRDGRTGNCATVPWSSTYGFGFGDAYHGGFLADLVHVPYADHMLVPLPAGIEPEAAASASDNIPDGYRTVAEPLAAAPGARVLVFQEYPQAFLAMKQGLADAFTTIVTILEAVGKKDPGFEIVGELLTSEPIALGVRENDSKWRDALNFTLQDMAADGTHKTIFERYFSFPYQPLETWAP